MPPGTPYNGFIHPYRIRVDEFTTLDPDKHQPLLHLLTHTHSDHILGLSAKSFGHRVVCSQDAKSMLLNHEVYGERRNYEQELRAENIRTYSHLFVKPVVTADGNTFLHGARDLLMPVPLNTPTKLELNASESITITLIDANHCPGAVMYLIEGTRGAVLHTGDFRAEPWFLESIKRNPFLQPYLSPNCETRITTRKSGNVSKTLEAIYLDTACALKAAEVPSKEEAVDGLIQLMEFFPESAHFFINSWTWGYEDILKAVARHFQQPIHVDRYKYGIYQKINDPFLKRITTQNCSTRFHACERFDRCDEVAVDEDAFYLKDVSKTGKTVVYVNAVSMNTENWREYLKETMELLENGAKVRSLLVPLHRHSPLPELQRFVDLFKPKSVVPNTLDPRLQGLDWACIDRLFAPFLHLSSREEVSSLNSLQARLGIDPRAVQKLLVDVQDDCDVTLKNLVGVGADSMAKRWADQGKLMDTIKFIRQNLGDEENSFIDRLQGISKNRPSLLAKDLISMRENRGESSHYRGKVPDSEDETDGDEDEVSRTAHLIFGVQQKENYTFLSSSPAQASEESLNPEIAVPETTKHKSQGTPVADGSSRLNMLTPDSSPVMNKPRISRLPQHTMTPTPSSSRQRRKFLSSNPFAPAPSPVKGKGKERAPPEPLSSPFQLLSEPKSKSSSSTKASKKKSAPLATVVHPIAGISTARIDIIDLVSDDESQGPEGRKDATSSYKRKRSGSLHIESHQKRLKTTGSPPVQPIAIHGRPLTKSLHHYPSTSSVSLSSASLLSMKTPTPSMKSVKGEYDDLTTSRDISRSSSAVALLSEEEELREQISLSDGLAEAYAAKKNLQNYHKRRSQQLKRLETLSFKLQSGADA